MANEELKKKIANIIDNAFENRCRKTNCQNCDLYPDEMCQPNMYADALIAAGIGDVSKHRFFISKDGTEIKQLYSGEEVERIAKERDEYKHRAEVAERALQIADELGELCGRKEDYVQQAEKELAEEKKSD